MSTEVGVLQANLTLDLSGFQAGIAEAASLAQQLGTQLRSIFNSDNGLSRMLMDIRSLVEQLALMRGEISNLQMLMNSTTGADLFAQMRAHTAGLASDLARVQSAFVATQTPAQQLDIIIQAIATDVDWVAEKINALHLPQLDLKGLDFSQFVTQLQQAQSLIDQIVVKLQSLGAVDLSTGEIVGNGDQLSALYTSLSNVQGINQELLRTISLIGEVSIRTREWLELVQQVMRSFSGITASIQQVNNALRGARPNMKSVGSEAGNAAKQTEKVAKNLQTAKGTAVSLKGILGGIVVAQSFYTLLNIMEELVFGAVSFSQNMQDSAVAFEYLFQNAETSAGEFLSAMQDMSLLSPLNPTDLTSAARKLMAMGFSAKATVPTLQILTDTAAVFSNNAGDMAYMIDHIALAFGQMIAAGKVSAQEMRQLYNAGLPIYELMSEGLGISLEMAKNIGHYNIDSATAVYATLIQLQERYGGAAKALSRTIAGTLSVISESFKQLLAASWERNLDVITEGLDSIARRMQALVKITKAYGIGGLFQAIFPEQSWPILRSILGGLGQIGKALLELIGIVQTIYATTLQVAGVIGAQVLPIVGTFALSLTKLARAALETYPALRYLISIMLLLGIASIAAKGIIILAKAIYLLSGAKIAVAALSNLLGSLISIVTVHPLITVALLAIAAAFLAIVSSSEAAKAAIMSFFDGISRTVGGFGKNLGIGFDPDDIAMPEFQQPDMGDFTAGLEDLTNGMNNLEDATEDAGDAAKKTKNNLQSFDEVYLISEDDTPEAALSDSLNNMLQALEGIGNLNYDNLFDWTGDWATDWDNLLLHFQDSLGGITSGLNIDWSTWAQNFWTSLVEALGGTTNLATTGILGLLGLIIGGLFGHPLLGMALGIFAAGFWNDLAKQLGITDVGQIALPITTVLGAAIGGLAGGPMGAVIGGAIGALIGWCIESVSYATETGDWSRVSYPFAIGIGAAIGAVMGGPMGAIVGGLIGLLVGTLIEITMKAIDASDWSTVGSVFGGGVGAAIGFCVGGPVGAVIGGAIGTLVGWLIGNLVEAFQNGDWPTVGATLGGGVGAAIGFCVGGPVGAVIGGAIGTLAGWIIGKFAELDWSELANTAKNIIKGLVKGLKKNVSDIWNWISNFGRNFLSKLKSVLGIHSPSKETDWMGEMLMEGMYNGIVNNTKESLEAAQKISEEVVKALTPTETPGAISLDSMPSTLSSLETWASSFVSIMRTMFDQINQMFAEMDTQLQAYTPQNLGQLSSRGISPIAATDQLTSSSYTNGAQAIRVLADLTENTVEFLSSKIAMHIYEYLAPLFAKMTPEEQQQVYGYLDTLNLSDREVRRLKQRLSQIDQTEKRWR